MAESCEIILDTGLRGVKIAKTRIGDVRGDEGKLIYRGYLIQDLAEQTSFEEVAYLLLYEKLPGAKELSAFKKQLFDEMHIPKGIVDALKTRPKNALPMDILQCGVSMLAHHDPDVNDASKEATCRMGIRLIAKMPVLMAAWGRIREGKEPLDPLPDLDHAGNFLYLLQGIAPDKEVAHFFDVGLTLHAEHSFNASTFAAREVASTRAHIYAAVAAAVGSLSGALHGGANTRVMKMLIEIGSVDAVENFVNTELDAGRRIMGMGHAVYNVDDPRAYILKPMSKRMGERIGDTRWYDMSDALERKAKEIFKKRKNIDMPINVDFYSASLYYAMGIPMDFFTPLFAISRIAGWTAHVIEEQFAGAAAKPMLYRPESEYVGDYCGPEECVMTPINKR